MFYLWLHLLLKLFYFELSLWKKKWKVKQNQTDVNNLAWTFFRWMKNHVFCDKEIFGGEVKMELIRWCWRKMDNNFENEEGTEIKSFSNYENGLCVFHDLKVFCRSATVKWRKNVMKDRVRNFVLSITVSTGGGRWLSILHIKMVFSSINGT